VLEAIHHVNAAPHLNFVSVLTRSRRLAVSSKRSEGKTAMSLINTQVQPFKVQAFHNGKFIEVTEQSLKGKWSTLIFMPAAFTFNCPTEVEDAADNYAEFKKLETEVYIVTTDSHFAHKVWHETSPAVGKAKFPLIGDPSHVLAKMFDVLIPEEGMALRGTFVINPDGIIKTAEVHSNEIARDVKETLRKLKAAQYTAAHPGQVCPAKWNEGAETITPSLDLVGKI
jgi:peroxiredoxin (alkyl hydroperoxide reductase subunit C)